MAESLSNGSVDPFAEIEKLLAEGDPEALEALLESPLLTETLLARLLRRKDLTVSLLERVTAHKEWLSNREIRVALVTHPHAPRRVALRLAREVHLMDLVGVSLSPSAPAEVRRFVEDLLVSRLPQLALGQKLAVARRGSNRIAGELLADGHPRVVGLALDNPKLTEAQVLRALAGSALSAAASEMIGRHPKWSAMPNVRVAAVRNSKTPLDLALNWVPELSMRDLADFASLTTLRPEIRAAIRLRLSETAEK